MDNKPFVFGVATSGDNLRIVFMKRAVLIAILLTVTIIAKAQYYYNPYAYAMIAAGAAAEATDSRLLDNIRFDENALKDNPKAWNAYVDYWTLNESYAKKNKAYTAVGWTGVGVSVASLVPFYYGLYADDWTALGLGVGMLGAGSITALVGIIGMTVQSSKFKANKREFIYYLKTTNNGVGIVTLF